MIVEGTDLLHLGFPAHLLSDNKECAWAEKYVRRDRDLSWVLGNYVEADNPNDNGHIFPLSELPVAQASLMYKPLNMLHHAKYTVGAFAGAELTYPKEKASLQVGSSGGIFVSSTGTTINTGTAVTPMTSGTYTITPVITAAATEYPVLEALAAFWRHNYPEEAALIQKAHAEGSLYFSMETVPDEIECALAECGRRVKYAGRQHDSYCDHINAPAGQKRLYKPHFAAGALIFPPVRPGWRRAEINELSQLLQEHSDVAEKIYAGIETDLPHLEAKDWESMMSMIMLQAKTFSEGKR